MPRGCRFGVHACAAVPNDAGHPPLRHHCGAGDCPGSASDALAALPHRLDSTGGSAGAAVEALAQTEDGFLWLGSGTGLIRFDGIRFELYEPPAHQSMPSTNVSALSATRDSGLWVGYRFGGVSLIRRDTIRSYGERDGLPLGTVVTVVKTPTALRGWERRARWRDSRVDVGTRSVSTRDSPRAPSPRS